MPPLAEPSTTDNAPEEAVESIADWIEENYPLLDEGGFMRKYIEILKSEGVQPPEGLLIVKPTDPAYIKLRVGLHEQYEKLCEDARLPHDNQKGLKAREALAHFIIYNGAPAIVDERTFLEKESAQQISDLITREDIAQELLHHVNLALGHCASLPAAVRKCLLDGLLKSALISSPGYPHKGLTATICNALELEIKLPEADQDKEYLEQLIFHSSLHPHIGSDPDTVLLLDFLSKEHASPRIRELAKQAVYDVRGSLRALWREAPVDQIASLKSRADRLDEALGENHTDDELIQTLFNNCKGEPLAGSDDPRFDTLTVLLSHPSERLRLAAALCLTNVDVKLPLTNSTQTAAGFLCEYALNSQNPRHVADALWIISNFESLAPHTGALVEEAMMRANERFIASHQGD